MLRRLASRHSDHPRIQRARDVLAFAARRGRSARLDQAAATLTLTTVLSIVPLLAVGLAMFAVFPLFADYREAFQKLLIKGLLPDAFSQNILRYLDLFTRRAGGLTAFGLAGLAVTALLMIMAIDSALNEIFRVRRSRPLGSRLLVYWALITLGPLVIGASLTLTSYIASDALVREAQGGLPSWGLDLLQVVLTGFALAALYVYVPYREVRWRDALIGGFTAALISQAVKLGFGVYVSRGTVTSIYGAFAAIPVFLVWVYVSWLLVLFGAAITAALPELRSVRIADEARAGNRFLTAVRLLQVLVQARAGSEPVRSLDQLALEVTSFPEQTEDLLRVLEKRGYVAELGGERPRHWTLVADPERTNLVAAFSDLAVDPANGLITASGSALAPWMGEGLAADWIRQPMARSLALPRAADPGASLPS
jgi:membrane protein